MMHDSDGHMMAGWMTGWMALWAAVALALIALAVVAAVWLVRDRSGGNRSHQDLLERRYAAGEIDREEFLQRRDDLARR
jgi:putative membrane protein